MTRQAVEAVLVLLGLSIGAGVLLGHGLAVGLYLVVQTVGGGRFAEAVGLG